WEIPQTIDTIDPSSKHYNPKSRYAKTLRRDGKTWGDVPAPSSVTADVRRLTSKSEIRNPKSETDRASSPRQLRDQACARQLAHDNSNITCQICHTSWATTCFGCHLPMRANQRVPLNKYEGILTRNYTTYNPQVVRDD